jgi:hypothetical protein
MIGTENRSPLSAAHVDQAPQHAVGHSITCDVGREVAADDCAVQRSQLPQLRLHVRERLRRDMGRCYIEPRLDLLFQFASLGMVDVGRCIASNGSGSV